MSDVIAINTAEYVEGPSQIDEIRVRKGNYLFEVVRKPNVKERDATNKDTGRVEKRKSILWPVRVVEAERGNEDQIGKILYHQTSIEPDYVGFTVDMLKALGDDIKTGGMVSLSMPSYVRRRFGATVTDRTYNDNKTNPPTPHVAANIAQVYTEAVWRMKSGGNAATRKPAPVAPTEMDDVDDVDAAEEPTPNGTASSATGSSEGVPTLAGVGATAPALDYEDDDPSL